jgi:hypothetical protein
VFGYDAHAKGKRFSATAFLIVGVIVAGLVAFWIGEWFWMQQSFVSAILMAILTGGLTLFFFWSGAGGFDKYVVDGLVNGVALSSGFTGAVMRKLQTGRVQSYIALVLLGMMILMFIFLK